MNRKNNILELVQAILLQLVLQLPTIAVWVVGLVNLIYRLVELVGWVLILLALFQRRSTSASDQVRPF